MGKLWYAREGKSPTGLEPRCEMSFGEAQRIFSSKMRFIGEEPPHWQSPNPDLDNVRDFSKVVFELPAGEPTGLAQKQIGFQSEPLVGFYLIDISIKECEKILKDNKI